MTFRQQSLPRNRNEMKSLLLLSILAFVAAVEIDWTKVRPIEELDRYWDGLSEKLQTLRYAQRSSRIISGNVANVGQFPYHAVLVSVFGSDVGLCGGSVLTTKYILTAAHCVVDASGGAAVMGAHNLSSTVEEPQIYGFSVNDITAHPNYNLDNIRNDVATVRVNGTIIFNDKVSPIKLPVSTDQRTYEGLAGTVVGYGRVSTANQEISEVPRYITDSIITNAQCLEKWENNGDLISAQNICLLGENNGVTCNGDSGGPLTVTDNGEALQVGIVSFGVSTCVGLPPVFARVSYFRAWIVANSDYNSATVHTTQLSLLAVALFFVVFMVYGEH